MTRPGRWLLLLGLVGVLAAESTPPEPDERAALVALREGDWDRAESILARLADHTLDPGQVAFLQGAILAHRGDYRGAELHYRRVLDDTACPQDRAARAWYNCGICLLRRGSDLTLTRDAITCFERSLPLADPDLAVDVRHNLEVAKLLWAQARANRPNPPRPNDPSSSPESNPPGSEPDPPMPSKDGSEGPGTAQVGKVTPERGTPQGNEKPVATAQPQPGAGTLPVLLDMDRPQALSAEDTQAYLKRVAERLTRERKATARMLAGPERPHVRDW